MKVALLCILFFGAVDMRISSQDNSAARQEAVTLAKEELARTLRASSTTIELVDVVVARWRDSALGCPEKGVVYAPVLTNGYVVRLQIGSTRHTVHVGSGRAVICAAKPSGGSLAVDRNSATTMTGLKRADEARAALATTLNVPVSTIVVDSFRPMSWADSRLGCDKEPAPAASAKVSGYVIQLSHRGRTFTFHSDEAGPPRQCAK